jgi:hypothetical protein
MPHAQTRRMRSMRFGQPVCPRFLPAPGLTTPMLGEGACAPLQATSQAMGMVWQCRDPEPAGHGSTLWKILPDKPIRASAGYEQTRPGDCIQAL